MALVSKNFSDIVTFTRASTATYRDSTGSLTTAAINAPRLDYTYNGTAWVPAGLLIEEQRTNLLLYSEAVDNATWTKGRLTISADSTTAPDGASTADKLVDDSTTNTHVISQSSAAASTTNTNPYTLSAFFKAAGRTACRLLMVEGSTFTRTAQVSFDLSGVVAGTPAVAGGASGASATIQSVGNGWYRCTLTATLGGADTRIDCRMYTESPYGTNSYLGDGSNGVYCWGAQLEAGAFATSYIPTTSAQVTRSADVPLVNALSPWYNRTSGTFVVEGTQFGTTTGFAFTVSDGTTSNRIAQFKNGTAISSRVVTGGAATNPGDLTVTAAALFKSALAYEAGSAIAVANGTLSTASSPASLPAVDRLGLGVDSGGITAFNGWLRKLTYYPTRKTNAELQTLTA